MPRSALYARVSTADQRPDAQLDVLRNYARAREFDSPSEYVDHGVSGTRDRRPALDQLVADARRRHFDVLVVAKLDRLARSVRHLVGLVAEFEALGIDLVVLDQGIDTSTPQGRLLFHTLAAIAEFERDLIRERVAAGMRAAKKRGRRIGRPRALDRFQRRELERLHAAGTSQRKIADALGASKGTISREVKHLAQRTGAA